MLRMSLAVKIILGISFASAIVSPRQLYKMIDQVVDLHMKKSCLVVISSGGYTSESYVPTVHMAPYNEEMQVQNSNLTSKETYKLTTVAPVLELGCNGFLIQTENPGLQLRLIEKTFVHVNERTQRKFIILPTTTKLPTESIEARDEILDSDNFDFRSVFLEESLQYIPDVILAIPDDENDRVGVFTHRFVGPGESYRQEILLDTYDVTEERFDLETNLFPDKIKDLEGKVLTVALFHYPPYAVVISENDNDAYVDGTEWRFAVEFAKLHNATLDTIIDNEAAWGHVYKNLSGIGVTGNVVEDKADLGMTALYTWYHESLFLDLTSPHYRSGITCLVPGPSQTSQWMSPIVPFSPCLWAIFVGMIIVSTIFTWIINRVESIIRFEGSSRMNFSESALTVAGITLLQGLRKDPKGTSWAVLSISMLIVSLLLATAYGSSLASAITVPRYEHPIDTAVELAASGIFWAGADDAWIFSIRDADEPEMQILVKNFLARSHAELSRHLTGGNQWAFSVERLQGGHYSIQDYISSKSAERMHLMKNDIYWEYCVSMLRKSSPFTRWYSQRILEIQASGLPLFWETDVTLRYLDTRTQLAVKIGTVAGDGPVRMTIQQIQGTFFILVIGLLLSALVFLWEMYSRLEVNVGPKISLEKEPSLFLQ